ncbi:MAG: hypothetical protein E5V58_02670 [Mesorhizobium sp.]|nr:MAG: hypothetical protein E5V58_02670 [Mesorhizobium sp.]
MLREVENRHPDAALIFGDPLSGTIDLETLLAAARRQLRLVLTCALAGLLIGLAYLAAEVPLYESTARILIDKNQPSVVTKLTESGSSTQLDPMMVSQVELLRSDRIGLKVVDSLGLASDRSFCRRRIRCSTVSEDPSLRWCGHPLAVPKIEECR